METPVDIELRSEKIRHIIGNIPPLLIRSGITFITVLVCSLCLAAWFIPYPENLKVPVTIISPAESSISVESSTESFRQATARLPYDQITQVTEGMTVQIELEGYPSRIYGYVHGSITHIDKSILKQSGQNYFSVTVTLSAIPPVVEIQTDMNGHAFILLSNKSILKHILKDI